MEVFQSMVGGTDTEVLYKYRSSQQPPSEFHGMPVALRHITADLGIIVTDFPLYFMEEAEAQQVITNGLMEFGEVTGIENDRNNPAAQPNKYSLNQNYPNPFNPSTRIRFSIPVQSKVVLRLYNTIGEELRVLVNEEKEAGAYEVEFNANNLPSGVYFYRLRAGNFVKTKKMILLR
ncbi:MAG TPA: T9SS type A sorting domain-containing protein [Ignavibacteriales bacterium]|nr:T9SS type A sorting domain-containing protein [Ignavibacteriales bacterium]